jgi:hypothetical protein
MIFMLGIISEIHIKKVVKDQISGIHFVMSISSCKRFWLPCFFNNVVLPQGFATFGGNCQSTVSDTACM